MSQDYYLKAIDVFRRRFHKIAVVVFTGGSTDNSVHNEDRKWTEDNIHSYFKASTKVKTFRDDDLKDDHVATLAVLTMCPSLIVGSSTFSWWGAYLANHNSVVAPRNPYHPQFYFVPEDYYLPNWVLLDEHSFSDIP